MSANTISISSAEVRQTAEKMKNLNSELTNRLQEIKQTVSNLNSTWDSDASRTIIKNMTKMESTFNTYHDIVDSYAQFLTKTAETYEDVETQIDKYASLFD